MTPRLKCYLHIILCVFLIISEVQTSVVKDALEEHLKDTDQNEQAEAVKHDKQKGEKFHQIQSQVDDKHSNEHSKENDEAKYLKKEQESKSTSDSDSYGGYNSQKDKAEDTQSNGFKKGHKKGHHKQGFQNSYHKDESSNKSTYFDDFNDEEDRAGYNSKQNSYNNQGNRRYQGRHNNGQQYLRDNYQNSGHNKYGDSGKRYRGHQDYGRKQYLDNLENYNKYRNAQGSRARDHVHDRRQFQEPHYHGEPGWDWQRWDDRRGWQHPGWGHDYDGPGYFDDHGFRHDGGYGYGPHHGYGYGESNQESVAQIPENTPVVAQRKQTITIYEDPRYSGNDRGQVRREEGDRIQLDFRPSTRRYASYDDTYYSAPSRSGTAESSKINRLVYNYRRQ